MNRPARGVRPLIGLVTAGLALAAASASGQNIGALVSPGPLSRAHAKLEGIENCQKCHEPGRKVTAARCLQCHKPIADEISGRRGVHRAVNGDCVSCHVEHAGRDADIRPIDTKSFKHLEETGFPLDGKHAALAANCAQCHKIRSFLGLSPACASCHLDPHKGALGPDCARCHATSVGFKETERAFDSGPGPWKPGVARPAQPSACEARGDRELPEVPRAGKEGHGGKVPPVPQADRR